MHSSGPQRRIPRPHLRHSGILNRHPVLCWARSPLVSHCGSPLFSISYRAVAGGRLDQPRSTCRRRPLESSSSASAVAPSNSWHCFPAAGAGLARRSN